MRKPRLKLQDCPAFYHLYNRVAGDANFLPFGPKEKEYFVQLLHKLDRFYTIKVVSYQVMSNHFHLVVHAPDKTPSLEEICRRYEAYHDGKRRLLPSDPRAVKWAARVRDISWYMQTLQQSFTRWFNRTRRARRRGGLWADRFKHTLLGDAQAVWECCKYVEMNPVRARIVESPADYRFCSYGTWSSTGRHPFQHNVQEALFPCLQGVYPFDNLNEVYVSMSRTFAGIQGNPANSEDDLSVFITHLDRRVRFWVDSLLIGSELFLQEMTAKYRIILNRSSRRNSWIQALSPRHTPLALCAYKKLRRV